jgi:hypothetical protein
MDKSKHPKNTVCFDVANGIEHIGYKEQSFPIERVIQICEETTSDDKNTKKPVFQEYQVTVEGMRLYLRTDRAMPDRLIKARILTLPGRGKTQDATLISIDDLTDIKSSIRENRLGNSKKRVSNFSFLKRNKWWLLALVIAVARACIYIPDKPPSFSAASVFHLYPYLMMPLLIILLCGFIRLFQNLFGFGGSAKRDDLTDSNGKKKMAAQLYGQHVVKTSEVTFLDVQLPKTDHSLLFGLELREGRVKQVQYSYLVRENDGTDCSAIECTFQLIDASNRVVHCRYEVSKRSALLFLQEDDDVRVVGKFPGNEMQVSYALNRSDEHTYCELPMSDFANKLKKRNNLLPFSLQAMYNATEMLIVGIFLACLYTVAVLSFVLIPLGILIDLIKGPDLWNIEVAGLWEPAKIALSILGLIWLYVLYRSLKRVLEWSIVRKMLGLGSTSELLSRVRVVCNEDTVPFDVISFNCRSDCLNPQDKI